jgi:hypothetical protein
MAAAGPPGGLPGGWPRLARLATGVPPFELMYVYQS